MFISKWFIPITLLWFFLSILCAWFSLFFFKPFDFLIFTYFNYRPYIVNYDLFCMCNFFAFILAPLTIPFYLLKGFNVFVIVKHKAILLSLFSLVLFMGMYAALGFATFESSARKVAFARDSMKVFDWPAAFFISFLGLYVAAQSIVIIIGAFYKFKPQRLK